MPDPANPGKYTISNSGLTAFYTTGLTVPPSGQAIFFVQHTGAITGHIFQVGTTTEVPGGTIGIASATIGPLAMANPANFTNLLPDTYGAQAIAPPGYLFVPDSANPSNYSITNNGSNAIWTNPFTVPPGGNAVFFVARPAQYTLTKTVSPSGTVSVGTDLTYTVTITNTGGIAGSPGTVDDVISGTATHTLVTPPFSDIGGAITGVDPHWMWAVPVLQPGESGHLTLTITATSVGEIDNVATNPNTPPGHTTTIVVAPAFTLTKTVSPSGTVPTGTVLIYTVTISNNGTGAGSPGLIDDIISTTGGATYSVVSNPAPDIGGLVLGTDPHWVWLVPTLQPGESGHLVLSIKALTAGAIDNVASNPNTPLANTHTPVISPDFVVTKTVSPSGTVPVGTPLAYTVTVTNNGTGAGSPGTLDDIISTTGGATYTISLPPASDIGGAITGSDPHFLWTVPTLQAGASGHLTMTLIPTAPGAIDNDAVLPNTPPGHTHTPVVSPQYTLTKTVSPSGTVATGTDLTYTVTISNIGTGAGSPGVVTDVISTSGGATYAIVTPPTPDIGGAVGGADPVFTWQVPVLQPGHSGNLTMVITALTPGTIVNTASNPNTPPSHTTTVVVAPAYTLTKTVSPSGTVPAGTVLVYTVTITNTGTGAGSPGIIDDLISTGGGATYVVVTSPQSDIGGLISGVDPHWVWLVPTLQPGDSGHLVLSIKALSAGFIDNVASNPNTPPANTHTPVIAPNYTLAKTVTPSGTVTVGTSLTYTVTVSNNGTAAGSPGTLDDLITLSGGATYTVTGTPVSDIGGSITGVDPHWMWAVPVLQPGHSGHLTLVIQATGAGHILNTASLPQQPQVPPVTVDTPVIQPAAFDLTKTVTPTGTVNVGDTLTYTVTVTNTGGTAGSPGNVDDVITTSGGATYSVLSGPTSDVGGAITGVNPHWVWAVPSLAPGHAAHLTLVIKATADGTIVNDATNPNTPPGHTTTTVVSPNVTIAKAVSSTTATIGDTLTYTVTVSNSGTGDATNVLIDDVFSGSAGFLVNDGSNGTTNSFAGAPLVTVTKLADGHYQWTYATLAAGATATLSFTAQILAPASGLPGGSGTLTLTNTAVTEGAPPATVSTTAPFSGGQQGQTPTPVPTGGVFGVTTSTPSTGTQSINLQVAGLVFLAGFGLVLLGILLRRPREDES